MRGLQLVVKYGETVDLLDIHNDLMLGKYFIRIFFNYDPNFIMTINVNFVALADLFLIVDFC